MMILRLLCLLVGGALGTEAAAGADDERNNPKEPAVPSLWTRQEGSDWPQFLGPAGDGKSPEKGILTKWPKDGPRVLWHRRVDLGYGMPSLSKGRLFQFGRRGNDARLVCLNAETGAELWEFTYRTDYDDLYGYNNGPRCSPVIDGDRVYLYGVEGTLHCLNAVDGKLRWRVDANRDFGVVQNFFGVGSTPVIDGDLLIVQVGGSPAGAPEIGSGRVTPAGSAVVAFDKLTGKVRYAAGDELASYAGPALATIDSRRWCLLFARSGLLAFEPASGKIDFHFPWRAKLLESVNASNPVVVGNEVFLSECYGPGSALLRVRPGGYDVVWADDPRSRQKALQTHWNTPIHHEGYLYGSSGRHSHEAELRCVEWKTGKIQWRQPNLARCSLLYADGHFLCLSEYGPLFLLRVNPQKFDMLAAVMLRDEKGEPLLEYPAWAAPILSHGLLYLRDERRLLCLELIPPRRP